MTRIYCFLLFLLFSFSLFAREKDEKEQHASIIIVSGYLNISTKKMSEAIGKDGNGTFLHHFKVSPTHKKQGRNPVLWLVGKGGTGEDPVYAEAMKVFAATNGVDVYSFDWQSQGKSSSSSSTNKHAVHITSFSEYQEALNVFLQVVMKDHYKKNGIDVIALSMGAHNALRYSHGLGQETMPFGKIIAISPMVGFNTPFPSVISRTISNLCHYLGFGESFALSQKPWRADSLRKHHENKKHVCTEATEKHIQHFSQNLHTARHGVSYSWIAAAYEGVDFIDPFEIAAPVMMVVPESDEVVPTESQLDFASKLSAKGSKTVVVKDVPHDVFFAKKEKVGKLLGLFRDYLYEGDLKATGNNQNTKMPWIIHDVGFRGKKEKDSPDDDEDTLIGVLSGLAFEGFLG